MNSKYLIVLFFSLTIITSCNNVDKTEEQATKNDIKKTNNKKKIILTFDDGPTVGSKKLYDLLKQEQIPAALYLVGEHYDKSPSMHSYINEIRTMPGIVIANHSYSHAWHDKYLSYYSHPDAVVEEYQKSQQVLGITSNIARCAGRNVWRISSLNVTDTVGKGTSKWGLYPQAIDSLYQLGYQFTGWDCTWPYDYKTFKNTRDVAGMMKRINIYFDSSFTKTPNYLVLLGHDQQFADDDDFNQLRVFIDSIKASNKYEFVSIKEYPGIK